MKSKNLLTKKDDSQTDNIETGLEDDNLNYQDLLVTDSQKFLKSYLNIFNFALIFECVKTIRVS